MLVIFSKYMVHIVLFDTRRAYSKRSLSTTSQRVSPSCCIANDVCSEHPIVRGACEPPKNMTHIRTLAARSAIVRGAIHVTYRLGRQVTLRLGEHFVADHKFAHRSRTQQRLDTKNSASLVAEKNTYGIVVCVQQPVVFFIYGVLASGCRVEAHRIRKARFE